MRDMKTISALRFCSMLLTLFIFTAHSAKAEVNSEVKIEVEAADLQEPIIESDPCAVEIMQKMTDKYKTIKTYSAVGQATIIHTGRSVERILSGIDGLTSEASKLMDDDYFKERLSEPRKKSFSIKIARPNLYSIEWSQKTHETKTENEAVWSVGDDNFAFAYNKIIAFDDLQSALAYSTGGSGWVSKTIPSLFFENVIIHPGPLTELRLEPDENIDSDECYVVLGKRKGYVTDTYWISKRSFLIRQRQTYYDHAGAPNSREVSEEETKKALELLGEEVTPEAIVEFKKYMVIRLASISDTKLTVIQTYKNIEIDKPIQQEQFIPKKAVDIVAGWPEQFRVESAQKMKRLLLAILMYATDNENKLPNSLEDINLFEYIAKNANEMVDWVPNNVGYLGEKTEMSQSEYSSIPIAYDKFLQATDSGTNVAFMDGHVEFVPIQNLHKYGIKGMVKEKDSDFIKMIKSLKKGFKLNQKNDMQIEVKGSKK